MEINQADLLSAYSDVDNDTLNISNLILVDPTSGSIVESEDGNYRFIPTSNFNGIVKFSYEISDGKASVQQSYFITVNPINDAPEGLDTALTGVTGEELVLKPGDFGFKDIVDRDA